MGIKDKYNGELRHIEYAVEKYSKMLFRISYGMLMNEHDAEDQVQNLSGIKQHSAVKQCRC